MTRLADRAGLTPGARRAARFGLVAALVLPWGVIGGSALAQPTETVRPAVVLTLTALEPRAPRSTDEVVVRGEVRNAGAAPIGSARVRLRISTLPVGSRSALAAQASSTASFGGLIGAPGAALDLPDIPAGGRAAFTLRAPMGALNLPRPGVYPFGVELRGDHGDGAIMLRRLRTWLPFAAESPAGAVKPTSIAWLWPLVDLPDRNPDGTFPSERLAASIRPTGRLGRLLGAASAGGRPGRRLGPYR